MVNQQPLAERNLLSFAPSASVLMMCWLRDAHRSRGDSAAVVSCPNPGGEFPNIPQAKAEALAIAELLRTSPVVADQLECSKFLDLISGVSTIHFSGHAIEDRSGWQSGLQLGGGQSITAAEFFQFPLNANLITLSGCRTARQRLSDGDELLGLVPSLLYAGASSVLASQWEAFDHATERLMQIFYRSRLGSAKLSKAEALQSAVTALRVEYPELQHWANFTLHGDWK